MLKVLSSQAKGSLVQSAVPVQVLQRSERVLASTSTTALQLNVIVRLTGASQLGALTVPLLGAAALLLLLRGYCEKAAPAPVLQAACTAVSRVVGCVDLSKVTSRTPTGKFSAMSPSWRCFAMAT
jgi:hypothetical protein